MGDRDEDYDDEPPYETLYEENVELLAQKRELEQEKAELRAELDETRDL